MTYERFIIGVSSYGSWNAFNFIFNDGTRTDIPDDNLAGSFWQDYLVEKDKWDEISKVTLVYWSKNSQLYGISFESPSGEFLMGTDVFFNKVTMADSETVIVEIDLKPGERVVGAKSSGHSFNIGYHFNIQVAIGSMLNHFDK